MASLAPRRTRGRVEENHGRNCVAAFPSGKPAERLRTPWGTEILVLSDPSPKGMVLLASPDRPAAGIRFWLSPCGDRAYAWTAGDVAHFQLFCDLGDVGWRPGLFEPAPFDPPVIRVPDDVAETLIGGDAGSRMAGGPYAVETGRRSLRWPGDAELPASPGASGP